MLLRLASRSIGLGLAALAAVALLTVLWVLVYALLVAPGHGGGFYQSYAARVSPLAGLMLGLPLLFLAGFLAGRGEPRRAIAAAGLAGLTYAFADLSLILAFVPWSLRAWPVLALGWSGALLAAMAGGWLARARAAE